MNEDRNNNFDALRFALATVVIASHSYPLLSGNNLNEPVMLLTNGQTTGGELAVSGFFALSGFLIAQSWERSKNAFRFFKKRILRIYPGFLVAVAFGAFVVAPNIATDASTYWNEFSFSRLLASAFNLDPRLPRVFSDLPIPAVNGSLWSIRYEVLCYVGLSFLGLIGAFRNRLLIWLAFVAALALHAGQIYLGLKLPNGGLAFVFCEPGPWPKLAALYLSGTLCYLYRNSIVYSLWLFVLASLGLIVCGAFPQLKLFPLVLPLCGTYLLIYTALLPIPGLQRFAARGDISYGLYLYAFPIQQLLVHRYGNTLTPLTLFLAAFPLTALVAAVSWRWVERPFLTRKLRPAPEQDQPEYAIKVPNRSETAGVKVPWVYALISAAATRGGKKDADRSCSSRK